MSRFITNPRKCTAVSLVLCAALVLSAGCSDETGDGWQVDERADVESDDGAVGAEYEITYQDVVTGCCNIINMEAQRDDGNRCIGFTLATVGEDGGYDVETPQHWYLSPIRLWQSSCDEASDAPDAVAERASGWIGVDYRNPHGRTGFDFSASFGEPIDETFRLVGER